jgi:hypothetical protein
MISIEGLLSKFSIQLIGGIHIGARALLVIELIWFGYIARLSHLGGRGYFTCRSAFYLSSRRLEEGEWEVAL